MPLYPVPENLLLRAAARARLPHLARKLKHLTFEAGQELRPSGGHGAPAIFPVRGLISLQVPVSRGKRVEIGMVGREGFAGICLLLGTDRAKMTAVALTDGEAVIMPQQVFKGYLVNPAFRAAAERYAQLFIAVVAHGLVCNRVHVIENLCTGRLLQMQDRTQIDTFHLTQDSLSRHLGVRRASINRAVAHLQKEGAIRYDRRGKLMIVDRRRLERLACTCYRAVKAEFDRLVEMQGGL